MKSEPEKTFADRLWDFRRTNGLSQAEAARTLGVKKATLQAWEHGRYKPAGVLAGLLGEKMDNRRMT